MAHRPEDTPVDERLARLLEVERRLEARVSDAERAAEAQVAEAREAARRLEKGRGSGRETAAQAEEDADLERHGAQLGAIAEASAARVARLAAVHESEIDRLARRAAATVLAREGAGPP